MNGTTDTALVVGAGGVVGRPVLDHFAQQAGWSAIAASRVPPKVGAGIRRVAIDLQDPEDCRRQIAENRDVSHIFFAAYKPAPDPIMEAEENLSMLVNLVSALEAEASAFQHINLVHGQKWYGNHLGPYRTPAREDDPRHMPPNFYYDQQDFIAERQKGKDWNWSSVRVQAPLSFSVGSPMNQVLIVGVYGSICRALGQPLHFPGPSGCFGALYQVTDPGVLARAMQWVATQPSCANQAFNVTNGDLFRWRNLWPHLAEFFGVPCGEVRTRSLVDMMGNKGKVWDQIVKEYNLKSYKMEQLVNWRWGDFIFGSDFDNVSSTIKIRKTGFSDCMDSMECYINSLEKLRAEKIIP